MKRRNLREFKINTDHLILARRPDTVLINKKKKVVDFAVSDHIVKKVGRQP